ncbi:hypothetical protein SKAU_G00201980 [Synaphobranchus kaupii]|uniref:Uncharacterized protein n=1 Tax=Synaphobranchus kaupii TaxID=118154 RepID=A0A9Q1FFP0_SYNKA|nr:hypothetical protein SKAU_G00201980 [Synaphobranchus kaupii]
MYKWPRAVATSDTQSTETGRVGSRRKRKVAVGGGGDSAAGKARRPKALSLLICVAGQGFRGPGRRRAGTHTPAVT